MRVRRTRQRAGSGRGDRTGRRSIYVLLGGGIPPETYVGKAVELRGRLFQHRSKPKLDWIRAITIKRAALPAPLIQLPPDLFFGTTIGTCVIVLKKSKTDNKTLFIDGSAEFVRSGNKNKLSDANQARILEAFTARIDVEHFAKLVDNSAIAENAYNIAVSSYLEAEDTREVVDIQALNDEIARIVARQSELRTAIDAIVADLEVVSRDPMTASYGHRLQTT